LKVDLFDSTMCALFISLHTRKITKVSDTAPGFFRYPASSVELIEKPLVQLIPGFMETSFNRYLDSLLDEGNMEFIRIGEFLMFFRWSLGNSRIVFPVFLRMKVDILDSGEFGLSMLCSPCETYKVCLVIDG